MLLDSCAVWLNLLTAGRLAPSTGPGMHQETLSQTARSDNYLQKVMTSSAQQCTHYSQERVRLSSSRSTTELGVDRQQIGGVIKPWG